MRLEDPASRRFSRPPACATRWPHCCVASLSSSAALKPSCISCADICALADNGLASGEHAPFRFDWINRRRLLGGSLLGGCCCCSGAASAGCCSTGCDSCSARAWNALHVPHAWRKDAAAPAGDCRHATSGSARPLRPARTHGYDRPLAPRLPFNRTLGTDPRHGFHEPVGMLNAAAKLRSAAACLSVCVVLRPSRSNLTVLFGCSPCCPRF